MKTAGRIHPVYAAMERTVFDRMSALAREHGAINLGQGFPDAPGPQPVLEAAARALREKSNQYPPGAGLSELREAICGYYARRQGLALSPEQVTVTSGATEAIAAAVLAPLLPARFDSAALVAARPALLRADEGNETATEFPEPGLR